MKIYQLYYTFCKKGLSSGKVFQTYSMSSGISEKEKGEIERHCFYIRPEGLSSAPVSFSFFKLKNGKPCICRTKYRGIDNSAKVGNYFCHVLIWENKELPFYPIQLYTSKIFKDELTEEEENAQEIKPLPILNNIPKEEFIQTSSIERFLKANLNKKREEGLNKLIDGIIDAKINGKKVILADEAASLHMWIAAATMIFPISIANNITFNTYNFDAESDSEFLCGAAAEGTKFKISGTEKNYNFNMFDLFTSMSTEVNLKSKFGKKAALEYTVIKDYRRSIIEFMELFNYTKVDERIDDYVNLLSIINEGLEKLSNEEVIKAVSFANEYALEPVLEGVMERLNEETLGTVILSLDLNMLQVMFEFLFNIAEVTKKKDYIDKAYEFFFNAIQFMVVNAEEIDIEDIIKLYGNIRSYNKNNIQDFISKSIEDKRLEDAKAYLNDKNVRYALFYMCSVFGNFIFLDREQNSKIPWEIIMRIGAFEDITKISLKVLVQSKNALIFLYKIVSQDDDYFANLVSLSANICTSKSSYDIVIAAYNEILEGVSIYKASHLVKKILDKENGGEILIFAYKFKMKKISKRKTYFRGYCLSVFDENPKYRRKYFSLALEELMLGFKAEDFNMEFYNEFTEYIEKRKLEKYIGKFIATRLVNRFQDLVLIEIPDEEQKSVIEEMNFLNNYYSINVSPNISEMIHYAQLLFTGSISVEKFLCDEKKFEFHGIGEEKYVKVLKLMFEIICPKLNSTSAHIKMKNILMYDKFFIIYFNTYINTMGDIFTTSDRSSGNKKSYKLYCDFIYFIMKCKTLFTETQFKDIEKFIFETLEKVDLDYLKNYDKYMKNIIINSSKSEEARRMKREWQKIYKNLNDSIKRKYILNKLQKIYKRKIGE